MLAERAATWPKQWKAEGYQKGREEGRISGWLDGQRTALAQQAAKKFGDLEPRYVDSIAKASEAQLRMWFERILTAGTPDDLFRT